MKIRTAIVIILVVIMLILGITFINNTSEDKIIISNEEIELEIMKNEDTYDKEKDIDFDKVTEKIFQEKVLNKESQKRNINIDNGTQEKLKEISLNNTISEENKRKIESLGLSEEEFREYLYNNLIEMQKRVLLKKELLEEINNNNIKIDNENFKEKVDIFNSNRETNSAEEVLITTEELLNEYITILEQEYEKVVK